MILAGISISIPRVVSTKAELPKPPLSRTRLLPWTSGHRLSSRPAVLVASAPSTPPNISEKVAESIKNAEATCAEDEASGECAAAWDEVEELSAAASHARDKLKVDDPLESFCKDNPDDEECRTYED
ncbi:CP12 [Musa troglodytarum]|uniref:CP12 n=1 Tax=Musa troglodytarum TaxID=320322 RepID=A0A9E7EV03_9LILI|nr:CP12 [Musa troglodytarum]